MRRILISVIAVALSVVSVACVPVFTNPPEPTVVVDPTPYLGEWELADVLYDEEKYSLTRDGEPLEPTLPALTVGVTMTEAGDIYVSDAAGDGHPSQVKLTEVTSVTIASVFIYPGWQLWTLSITGGGDSLIVGTLDLSALSEDVEGGVLQGSFDEAGGEEGYPSRSMTIDEPPTALRDYLESSPDVLTNGINYYFSRPGAGGTALLETGSGPQWDHGVRPLGLVLVVALVGLSAHRFRRRT